MQINDDFSARVSQHTQATAWVPSPMPGVERKMLDRLGEEVARATSIVRYAPGSHFSPHVHTGGEEFLVLEGVFQDEHGDYAAGSYVRNPPQSRHTPGSEPGCTIFVKLWQFDLADRTEVRHQPDSIRFEPAPIPMATALQWALLHQDVRETVSLQRWPAATEVTLTIEGGAEVLVLNGGFVEQDEAFARHSWLRLPANTKLRARTGSNGATVWVKTGHLVQPQRAPNP